jgi:hypothetical protein
MTPTLEDAWRRLRLSATFRPLLYASWEQDNTQFQPPMRLHGEEVLVRELRFPGPWVNLDLAAEDPLAAYRTPFYRVDGHARLRRSRFLHVDLDLELRDLAPPEAIAASGLERPLPPPPTDALPAADASNLALPDPADAPEAAPGPWHVERLRQSRQVKVGELHYFDSPTLGALALVTAVERPN